MPATIFQRLRYQSPAAAVFLLALATTGAAAVAMAAAARAADSERFQAEAQRTETAIVKRLEAYVALLNAGAGLLAADPSVDAERFAKFAAPLDLRSRYPGIQGLGFSHRLSPSELPALLAAQRRTRPDFRVWPEGVRDEYHTIQFLEPMDRRNRVAIGYDMFTEPTRRAAMERARDTGLASATGRVTLVQEIDTNKQPGFLIYVPVYEGGSTPATVDERRARLRGFVYAPFRAGDLLEAIAAADPQPALASSIYDGDPGEGVMLYRAAAFSRARSDRQHVRRIDVAGRSWSLVVRSTPEFHRSLGPGVFSGAVAAGLVISLLLGGITVVQTRARAHAERSEAALGESAARYQHLYERVQQLLEAERESRAEAERLSRVKDEFLATLSHELRTPLNAIIGWLHLMSEPGTSPEFRDNALTTIRRNAQIQSQLISDMLDMSRIISGKLTLDTRPIDLASVVDAALNVVRPMADAKDVSLLVRAEPGSAIVAGDPNRLQQVAWNLLSNAVKFTPNGGTVDVQVARRSSHVELTVRDTGMGIDAAFLPHVFERFRQADGSAARQHGGLGLGLSIVRSLVEMHGGTVAVESAGAGRGAVFTVRLPLALTAAPAAETPADRSDLMSALTGARILVVDDEADARELTAAILRRSGASVTLASSAADALAEIERAAPAFHLLISDLGMPTTDGFALMRMVREHSSDGARDLPAIALSAYTRPEDRRRAFDAGYSAHMSKPFDPDALVRVCRQALAGAGHRV